MSKPNTVRVHHTEVTIGDTVWAPLNRGPQNGYTVTQVIGMNGERLLRFHNGRSLFCSAITYFNKVV